MADTRAPIRVELTRDLVESVHLVDAVVATLDGAVTVWGDSRRSSAIQLRQSPIRTARSSETPFPVHGVR